MASSTEGPFCIADFETLAKPKLSKSVYDFVQTGANDCVTLRDNITAFRKYALRPRMLRNVSDVNLTTTIQGQQVDSPVGISPVSYGKMVHPDGELALVRACQESGTCYIRSTHATRSLDELARAAPTGVKWYQLFLFKDRNTTLRLVRQAEDSGYSALVLTVDTAVTGHRVADLKNQFKLAPHIRLEAETGIGAMNYLNAQVFDTSITWEDAKWLKQNTRLPVIIKGILTAEDARIAMTYGMDGIVVSNHGGRQLDGVMAAIDALPDVVKVVNGRCEVYMDGGLRTGVDVLKALALGARAVFVGRPAMWSLAYNGQSGVRRMLQIFRDELKIAMMLAGVDSVKHLPENLVVKNCGCCSRL
ncbi:hypothetical protein ScPMuIL_014126 [Solemya velum]